MEAPHHVQGLRPARTDEPGPADTFPQFSMLPPELRVQVWQQAILEDNADRVVPVAHESWRVIPTAQLMAPSPVLAATAESRAEARRLYPVALPLVDRSNAGVFYMGGQRREQTPTVEETDQSTDEELWGLDSHSVSVWGIRRRVLHISLDRDIFFLGHRHSDWAPGHVEDDPSDWFARYTTRSLRRAERARIVRVMGTRLSWPYAAWGGRYGERFVRRTVHEADVRLRQTFVSVREIYYFVAFNYISLLMILRTMRHAASLRHFRRMFSAPGPTRDIFCMRYLAPLGEEAQGPDEDPYDIDY